MQSYFLRAVHPGDFKKLSCSLRPLDRAELAACHPKQKVSKLLRHFVAVSKVSRTFVYQNRVSAMGGITREGCVWLLTGKRVEKCPKAFLKTMRRFLQQQQKHVPFLWNWVDVRYWAARRFILHMGGQFTGEYIRCGNQKFLFFIFRRCSMGGIVQTGRTYVSTASQAFKTRKQQNRYYTEKLTQTAREKEALLAADKAQQGYLFRSAAEKQRELYEKARQTAATLQTKAAKNGLTNLSQTAQLVQEKARLQAEQKSAQLQQQTKDSLVQQAQETSQRMEQLKTKEALYRKMRNAKSSLWKLGKQLFSWFN